jgi:hypothetical protein
MCIGAKSEKCNNLFKEIFSLVYDVLALQICFVTLRSQAPDAALVSGEKSGVNPRHVLRNLFLLKLVTLTWGAVGSVYTGQNVGSQQLRCG